MDYLVAGYGLSALLFAVYRVWIGVRRRKLEQENLQLEQQGATLEEEI